MTAKVRRGPIDQYFAARMTRSRLPKRRRGSNLLKRWRLNIYPSISSTKLIVSSGSDPVLRHLQRPKISLFWKMIAQTILIYPPSSRLMVLTLVPSKVTPRFSLNIGRLTLLEGVRGRWQQHGIHRTK